MHCRLKPWIHHKQTMSQLFETFDPEQLSRVSLFLTNKGINCEVSVSDQDGLEHCRLYVSESDFDRAAELIEEELGRITEETAGVACGKCGSKNYTSEAVEEANSLMGGFTRISCKDCGEDTVV